MYKLQILYSIFLFVLLPCGVAPHNVLLTLVGVSGSQSTFIYRMGELFAKAGHDVTILRTEFAEGMSKAPKRANIARELINQVITDPAEQAQFKNLLGAATFDEGFDLSVEKTKRIFNAMRTIAFGSCESLLDNEQLMQQLKEKKFDVALIHFVDTCALGLSYHLGVNATIMISTAYMIEPLAWNAGAPWPVASLPAAMHHTDDRMTFVERFKNLFYFGMFQGVYQGLLLPRVTSVFRQRFGNEFPTINSLARKVQLYFVNSDPLIDFARPKMPNTIFVGGFMMENKTAQAIPSEWELIANSPAAKEHGFIIFSFGSVVNPNFIPHDLKMMYFKAFRRLKQEVIWRYEGKFPEAERTNVHTTVWMPQAGLLQHENIVAFMTHAGFNSVIESSYAGVPLVMTPFFGDQQTNAKRVEKLKYGVTLNRADVTENNVYRTLKKVIYDPSYKQNAQRISRMLAQKPVSNRENCLKWMEFLAEFGTIPNYESPSVHHLYLFQYLLLDVILVCVGVAIISCVLWYKLVMKLFGRNRSQRQKGQKEQLKRNKKQT